MRDRAPRLAALSTVALAVSARANRATRLAVLAAAALAGSAYPSTVLGCASCACGDPTLTVMGTAKPFGGRLRIGAEARLRWLASGVPGFDRIEVSEQRLALETVWAPVSELFLSIRVPLVRRRIQLPDFSTATLAHVGDVEASGKWFVHQDRAFDPRWLVALEAGLEMPTAPSQAEVEGRPLGFEAQLGSGSWDPFLGASSAWFFRPLSVYTSVRGILPTEGRFGTEGARARPGSAFLASVVAQADAGADLAVRAGLDLRLEAPFEEGGEVDPHSGGEALFFTPELLFGGIPELVLRLAISFPAWLDLRGEQDEGPTVRIGAVLDV